MHAPTLSSLDVVFSKYDLSPSSLPAPAKIGTEPDLAGPETHLWKLRVGSKVDLAIETTLRVVLGLIATGTGAYCAVQMFNFVNNDAMTRAVEALLR